MNLHPENNCKTLMAVSVSPVSSVVVMAPVIMLLKARLV